VLEHGVGHPDLDELIRKPKALDFLFEIVRVEMPGEYEKDSWILDDTEKQRLIPVLKQQGNELFKSGKYQEASDKYATALAYLDQFMIREKPNDVDWLQLNEQKLPILLNYAMCAYNLGNMYSCIEHTSGVLEHQPNNVKALFRRAKAHASAWNLGEARADLAACLNLDKSLERECNTLLEQLKKSELEQNKQMKEKLKGKLFG
jgi:AH receptor-interacting protein